MSDAALPRWDMTTVFPSLDSSEFNAAFTAALAETDGLSELFDREDVRRRKESCVDSEFAAAYGLVTDRVNDLLDRVRTLGAYIGCFVSTDAANELAESLESLLGASRVRLDKLITRYTAWVGTTDADSLLRLSQTAREHEYPLLRAQRLAAHQMPDGEEDLAAELKPASITGWSRMHGNMSARLAVTLTIRGEEQTLPMSSIRALANDPDRDVRRAAFDAELEAWESVAVPFAAALNGVKGSQQTVRRRRRYADDIEPTLISNAIDRATLEAMHCAVAEAQPDFRRYMDVKARALGLGRLAWYDVGAPLGASGRRWAWPDAEGFIRQNFGRFSERLERLADRAFGELWIDAEPRVGKEGGAYCTGIRPGESRVMMNYDGSFSSISTLAHELGHAYHNLNLADRKPLQRSTPMALAETASIFCETLAFDAALAGAEREERIALLDTALQRDLGVVVDVYSRFLFESRVFEKRAERDLTVSEFRELMTWAQRETYGDRVDPLHPYMWAVKGHYYIGTPFYNYPYTFGLLFGLGLYSRYLADPPGVRAAYDDLLSSTGLADTASLAAGMGVDIRDVGFWRSSLDVIRQNIADLQKLLE